MYEVLNSFIIFMHVSVLPAPVCELTYTPDIHTEEGVGAQDFEYRVGIGKLDPQKEPMLSCHLFLVPSRYELKKTYTLTLFIQYVHVGRQTLITPGRQVE